MRRWIRSKVTHRLLVHSGEDSIEGLLVLEARDGLLLADAVMHAPDGRKVRLSGETFIPRENVRIVQTVPPRTSGDPA